MSYDYKLNSIYAYVQIPIIKDTNLEVFEVLFLFSLVCPLIEPPKFHISNLIVHLLHVN